MNRRVRIFQVDAFTSHPHTGNPASVVPDAQMLGDEQMLALARTRSGDTAFLLPPDGTDHDLRVRFFTPRAETGFVGHATIAAHAVLEKLGSEPLRRQKQSSGIIEIEQLSGAAGRRYAFSQPPPPPVRELDDVTLQPLLGALGLAAADLDARCPAVIAGAGGSRALLAVRDGKILAQLRPDLSRLTALAAAGSPPGCFIYTLFPALADCATEARMFCPAIGIAEDPVSGNAHALLAVYLYALGLLPGGAGEEFTGRQGHHLGRPGMLQVRVTASAGVVQSVRIAGAATVESEAEIDLP